MRLKSLLFVLCAFLTAGGGAYATMKANQMDYVTIWLYLDEADNTSCISYMTQMYTCGTTPNIDCRQTIWIANLPFHRVIYRQANCVSAYQEDMVR